MKDAHHLSQPKLSQPKMSQSGHTVSPAGYRTHALHLNYQLQFDLKSGVARSAEALLRNLSGPYSNRAPLELIEAAERAGRMSEITLWAVNQALSDFPELHQATGIERVAVNVSPSDIVRYDLVDSIAKLLGQHRIPGYCLEIEITEQLPLNDLKRAINNIKALSSLGVQVVLDDFGTGYTSLPMLINLPITGIKLDQMFCLQLQDHKHRSIAHSLITLSETLNMSIMVEGIENEMLKQQVMAMGCNVGQGFYLHSPQSKAALTGKLSNVVRLPFNANREASQNVG